MPSLMRFLTLVGAVAAFGFASLFALGTFVTPKTRDMVVTIPAQRLKPAPVEAAAQNPKTAGAEDPTAAATAR